jgi:hypothetical protein
VGDAGCEEVGDRGGVPGIGTPKSSMLSGCAFGSSDRGGRYLEWS